MCWYLPDLVHQHLTLKRSLRCTNCAGAEPRLRYYDLAVGNGALIQAGSRVMVHFDCKYRGLSVVSTRNARVLGGNRTVAEVRGAGFANCGTVVDVRWPWQFLNQPDLP
jgi:hypothetical protein